MGFSSAFVDIEDVDSKITQKCITALLSTFDNFEILLTYWSFLFGYIKIDRMLSEEYMFPSFH